MTPRRRKPATMMGPIPIVRSCSEWLAGWWGDTRRIGTGSNTTTKISDSGGAKHEPRSCSLHRVVMFFTFNFTPRAESGAGAGGEWAELPNQQHQLK